MSGELTSPAFIRRLETLYLLARKVLGGSLQSDRKSMRKGTGITFADYSEYHLGDDFRAIDWGVYARLDQLVVKLFEMEEDLTLHLLLDHSPSMAGSPEKWLYARKVAAALAYIAYHSHDRVAIHGVADTLRPVVAEGQGRGKVFAMLEALERAETTGSDSDFTACCKLFQARCKRRGMVVVISDLLMPGGIDEGLKRLQYQGHDLFCIQVQDQRDRRCELHGEVEIECVETGARQRVTVTNSERKRYEEAVVAWNEAQRRACLRRGVGLVSTTPELPFEDLIQGILRRGGLVA